MMTPRAEKIANVLREHIRLTADCKEECEHCGDMTVGVWRVKPGNIEHCAQKIDEALNDT